MWAHASGQNLSPPTSDRLLRLGIMARVSQLRAAGGVFRSPPISFPATNSPWYVFRHAPPRSNAQGVHMSEQLHASVPLSIDGHLASRAERHAAGAAMRKSRPLEQLAALESWSGRDALATLHAQDAQRDAQLGPLRYERMTASPFAFLRGSAAVMAGDLAHQPNSGIDVVLCGDAHIANVGFFATPERRLALDINDFDEAHTGPFEWDVKRLAASITVAGRDQGLRRKQVRRAARAAAFAYRNWTSKFAEMSPLEIWYTQVGTKILTRYLRGTSLEQEFYRVSRKAERNTGAVAVDKLTEFSDGVRRFRNDPPLLVRIEEAEHPVTTAQAVDVFRNYLGTLAHDRAFLLQRYALRGIAHKVVGVGSVGTFAFVLLLESGDGDPLLLQVKQAGESVLEAHTGRSPLRNHGERVVAGQHLLQAIGDPFLGWTRAEQPGVDFYVRQLRDMKGGFEVERLDAAGLEMYARLCGAVLARAHARAGDPALTAGYIGETGPFEAAIEDFAEAYADQTTADHGALLAALP